MQMMSLLPTIAEAKAELLRLIDPELATETAEALIRATVNSLERILVDSGRSFSQVRGCLDI